MIRSDPVIPPQGGGGGLGDMTKAVYDPQNVGKISGDTTGAGVGGVLSMVGGAAGAGNVITDGGDFGAGGTIDTSNGGGNINTSGNGGSINTSGDPDNALSGGSIDTTGTGSIELGFNSTRTTITGSATAPRAINLPDFDSSTIGLDTSWVANGDTGNKTAVIPDDTTLGVALSGLEIVSAGSSAAIFAMGQKIKALEAALAAQLRPNA